MLVRGWSAGYSDLHVIRGTFYLAACIIRQVERIWSLVFKDAEPLTDLPHWPAIEFCPACAIQHDERCLPAFCCATKCLPSRQVIHRKRDVLPPGSLRCDVHRTENSACLIGLRPDKHTHICCSLIGAICCRPGNLRYSQYKDVIWLPKQIALSCSHQGRLYTYVVHRRHGDADHPRSPH